MQENFGNQEPLVMNAILKAIKRNPRGISRVEIEEVTGLPTRTVQGSLKRLQDKGDVDMFVGPFYTPTKSFTRKLAKLKK